MTNVTHSLSAKKLVALNQQMGLLYSGDSDSNSKVFSSLLTEVEQIMLVKRVAAILMLEAKHSNYRVAQTLQLSQSTVGRYQAALLAGEYDDLLGRTKSKQFDSRSFWSTVETLLRAGLPPIVGPGRWQQLSTTKYAKD